MEQLTHDERNMIFIFLQPAEESTEEEYDRDLQDWEGNEKVENDSALLTGKNWESSKINRRTFQKK